ncbi:MAG: LysR family transcriptional regulator [Pseudomonadota bacterium]
MQKAEDLNDLRLVALIAETGSLSGAAERLGVNHATVFRRLGQLEGRLGVRVFERSGGRYHATAAGEELAKTGAQLHDLATQALLKVAGQDLRPKGMVRISTTDSVAQALLPPILARCRQQYPQITLSVEVENRAVNLSKRDADIAIRPTQQPPEHLIGKCLAPLNFSVYGGTRYIKEAGARTLAQHEWIALDESFSGHRTLRWLENIKPLADVGYRTNSFGNIRQTCINSLGLALLPAILGDNTPGLVRIGERVPECAVNLWLLTHPDLRETTRIKVVFQFLQINLEAALKPFSNEPR